MPTPIKGLPHVGDTWRNTETDESGIVVGYAPDAPYMGDDGKLYPTTSPVVKYDSGETLFGVIPSYTLPNTTVTKRFQWKPVNDFEKGLATIMSGGINLVEESAANQFKNAKTWQDYAKAGLTAGSPFLFNSGPLGNIMRAATGTYYLADENGLPKTYREYMNGNLWKGTKSLAGDILNGAMGVSGYFGMADDALNLAARLGNTDAKSIQFAKALNGDVKSTGVLSLQPELSIYEQGLWYQRPTQPWQNSSYAFYERPSVLSEAERAGIPKGERNNVGGVHADNVYGDLRFIRNIDGMPYVDENGMVHLANTKDNLLANFTTDLPFRLHGNYPYIPGSTYMTISPRAFKGKQFLSIYPGDSFLPSQDAVVSPNYVRIISGNPEVLEQAQQKGLRTTTSDKLQSLYKLGTNVAKKEYEEGLNGGIRDFSRADNAADNLKWYDKLDANYPKEGVVTPYREEVDRIITDMGRPTDRDYKVLEDMTGLSSGIQEGYSPQLIENARDKLATQQMFKNVYYDTTADGIEAKLMDDIGLYAHPAQNFSNNLVLRSWLRKNNIKPLKYYNGGPLVQAANMFGDGGVFPVNPVSSTYVAPKGPMLAPSVNIGFEENAVGRAHHVYNNYAAAKDTNLSPISAKTRGALRYLKDNVWSGIPAGVSNCTLSATQWVDPTNPIGNARSIVTTPSNYGYTKIQADEAVPGNLIIAKVPDKDSYHTMMITGFADKDGLYEFEGKKYKYKKGEPLVTYSKGGSDDSFLRKNIPLSIYTANSDGHTINQYYRYNYPNEVFLPDILVQKALGGTLSGSSDSLVLADNNNYIQDFKGGQYGLPTVRYDDGGDLDTYYIPYSQISIDPATGRMRNPLTGQYTDVQVLPELVVGGTSAQTKALNAKTISDLLYKNAYDGMTGEERYEAQKRALNTALGLQLEKTPEEYSRISNANINNALTNMFKDPAKDLDKVMLGTLAAGVAPMALPELVSGAVTALANPYVDATLTSYFGAHGINDIANGEANAITALEVLPMARLAKPLWNAGKSAVNYMSEIAPEVNTFITSPYTGKWATFGNKQYRFKPGYIGMDGVPVESRSIPEKLGIDTNTLRTLFEDYEKGLTQYKGDIKDIPKLTVGVPKVDVSKLTKYDLVEDNFAKYLSEQTGKTIKRVPIKDTKHGDLYSEGFAFVDEEGNEIAHIAGNRKGGQVWVESSSISPEFRNKGLGTQMYYDFNDNIFDKYGTTLHSSPYQRVGSLGNGQPSPSNKLWNSLRKKGLSTVEGQGLNRYDVMAEPSKTSTAYRSTPLKITKENAASITPEQWTAAQDAAIARGDMAEAQRLRDLHFKVNAPDTKVVDIKGSPQLVIHKTPNDFTVFDNSRSIGNLNWAATPKAFEGEDGVFATGAGPNPKDMRLYVNMKNPHYPTIDEGMEPSFIEDGEDGILGIADKDRTNFFKSSSEAGEGFDMSLGVDNPYALKSADAVTYDNNGVRIPLGERDNFNINDIRFSIGTPGQPYYWDPDLKQWAAPEIGVKDASAGKREYIDWVTDPRYIEAAEQNRKEAKAMGLDYVPWYDRPNARKDLNMQVELKPYADRNSDVGGYTRLGHKDSPIHYNMYSLSGLKDTFRHEYGHNLGFATPFWDNSLPFELASDSYKKQKAFLRYKASQVFNKDYKYPEKGPGGETIYVPIQWQPWEAAMNMRDMGADLGIKIGEEYPGYEKAFKMIKEYKGSKRELKEGLNLTKELLPYVWKALNGTLFVQIMPYIGAGVAGTVGYGLYDNFDSTNSDIHAYGGPLVEQANMFGEGGPKNIQFLPEIIITPDREYNQYLNTLPDNQYDLIDDPDRPNYFRYQPKNKKYLLTN